MLEFLGRFVVETLFQGLLELIGGLGHAIMRAIVPFATAGRVKVEPVPGMTAIPRWYGVHRLTDGTPVLGERLAAFLGIIVILAMLIAAIVAIKAL
jgi:hypothetical protein